MYAVHSTPSYNGTKLMWSGPLNNSCSRDRSTCLPGGSVGVKLETKKRRDNDNDSEELTSFYQLLCSPEKRLPVSWS